jgi:alpha-glucosidase
MPKTLSFNKWWPQAVVYQIYPRSFQDSNGDGVGDLPGIISRLDYLQSLKVNAIWLSPVYKSPMVDFGYDISDYCDVDPLFGTLADFDRLIKEAHKRGIKAIMDFVPNHTSVQHPWFLESKSSRQNPKRDWYIWRDPHPKNNLPNNWLSHFGGSAWELDPQTGQYYLHSFLKEQPDLNWRNPEVVKAMHNVLRFWLDRGADGFRTDAVDFIIKDEKFRNDPVNPSFLPGKDDPYHSLLHTFSRKQPEVFSVLDGFCRVLEGYQGRFMINEVYADIPEMEKYYRACGNGLLAPFNFNLMALPWAARDYHKFIDAYEASLHPQDLSNYVLGNHDHSRIATKYGQSGARLAALLTLTLRGLIVVYYGDELGMEDAAVPHDLALDPWEKNEPGFKLGRDPERSPMQWNGLDYAGFSTVTPWLPVAENYPHMNVEAESADTRSTLSLYRFLINFRSLSPALQQGRFTSLETGNEHIFVYTREAEGKKFLIVLNFSESNQNTALGFPSAKIICTTYLDRPQGESVGLHNFSLRPHEGYLLEI